MNIPFASKQFYGVFSAYKSAVWPMQLPLMALGVLAALLLVRQRSYSGVGISAVLTLLWACSYPAGGAVVRLFIPQQALP
jgi:hypothetical protein